jgi:hypothetical protein
MMRRARTRAAVGGTAAIVVIAAPGCGEDLKNGVDSAMGQTGGNYGY